MSNLMVEARSGLCSDLIAKIAAEEGIPADKLLRLVGSGKVVIVRNLKRSNVHPIGIGEGLRTKINANVGTSPEVIDYNLEVEKALIAQKYGADTVMDLSTGGDLDYIRREIIKAVTIPVGTVPIYEAAIEAVNKKGAIVSMNEDIIFNTILKQLKDGVDFITVHVGVTKDIVEHLKAHPRKLGMVSRGGVFHASWILHNNKENPLYANFDYLLEIAKEFDITLSLGDGLRPGCIGDATDWAQLRELLTISDLVKRAWGAGVQVMVEGPGHIPLNEIQTNILLQKILCKGAPFYVLGPLVTDIAPGYDHIVGAIGGALAGLYGADFLCYVTPSEHLAIPSKEDVKEGVIASKIAAHAVDIAKGNSKALKKDIDMAKARKELNWEEEFKLALDPEKARAIYNRVKVKNEACTMCGEYCAVKLLSEYLKDESDKKPRC
ncbi:MAG: phosphomethylpyrimidine synthase [Candidatus Odinarchaeum yellowstonii]|uniref:Phosphomethylpyrimidine synthase n=1 Tax=Odinarchaeota yellowstonii (strain LCB_4) TaxID=1841599 RepID=A0AAF0D3H9_ODILC|nr:MAG: phosphomethylpyrimidine synthase [Candidatus Odinarchaeum yellowstonii]